MKIHHSLLFYVNIAYIIQSFTFYENSLIKFLFGTWLSLLSLNTGHSITVKMSYTFADTGASATLLDDYFGSHKQWQQKCRP